MAGLLPRYRFPSWSLIGKHAPAVLHDQVWRPGRHGPTMKITHGQWCAVEGQTLARRPRFRRTPVRFTRPGFVIVSRAAMEARLLSSIARTRQPGKRPGAAP